MPGHHDLSFQLVNSFDALIEIVHFVPEQKPVSVWLAVRICDGAVVMLDLEGVKLENESSVRRDQAFVLAAAMIASTPEQLLVPAAAALHIGEAIRGWGRIRS